MNVRRFLVTAALLVATATAGAQDTSRVTVPKSMLTTQQMAQVTATSQLETVGKWVGLGREVGEAVNGSLAAISKQTVDFAQTDVGKLTTKVLVVKLLGPMIVHVLGGVLFLIIALPIVTWMLKNNGINHSVLERTDKDGNKFYRYEEPSSDAKCGYTVVLIATFAAWAAITFSW